MNGVIGIIANHPNELDLALGSGLQCVEVRADLLLDAGISLNQILELIQDLGSIQVLVSYIYIIFFANRKYDTKLPPHTAGSDF